VRSKPRRRGSLPARRRNISVALAIAAALIFPAAGLLRLTVVHANSTPQTLPFSQNWNNTGLITTNDDWSGVPGIEGYFLRNDSSSATGVDPQTLLGDTFAGAGAPELSVLANQTSTAVTNGDVAEFHTTSQAGTPGTDPTIALQGSGTADAPYILLYLNTTGQTGINVSYNLRDIDCTSDSAAQQVALQYRVGSSGNFTNVPAGYVADATTGPSLCTAVTPVSVVLPAAVDNQPLVQVRVMTTNAAGNDEWVGIDDISVTAGGGGGGVNLAINDVSQDEGNAGQTAFTFTISLSSATHGGVTFDVATADGTAQDDNPTTEDNDYQANSATGVTIPNGQQSAQFTVQVNGDTAQEPNETFFVNVTNVTGATVTDGQGQGTIVNDDVTLVLISQVQGNGAASPLAGQSVSVRGIVTLRKSNGFFLQEETADNDADPNTSEGIFVFTSAAPTVSVGDQATVTGTVIEFNGLTEISPVTSVSVNSTGNPLQTAVTLTAADLPPTANHTQPQLEKYEGMRLYAASLTTTAPNDNFFDVYTVITGQPRPVREPGIPANAPVPPDPTTGTPDCCIPIFDLNPERIVVDTNGRAGSTGESFTSNVVITDLAGPLDYAFGAYRIINEAAITRTPNMSAVPVPAPYPTEFTVAGFNIENFNNNATQRQKAALAIRDVMRLPDIIGVAEIFDLADLQALRDEVNSIAAASNPQYEAYLVEANGTSEDNDQDVGYLVKTSRVTVNSVVQRNATETYVNPNNGQSELLNDRPPLVLDASVARAGAGAQRVLVVVNHLRSFIDIEQVAGEGPRVRAKRKAQAESLANLVQELQTNNPAVPVISVGDYNAYQFSSGYDDSLSVIKGSPTADEQIVVDQSPDLVNPNFFNLIDELPTAEQYTFVFDTDKNPQALDHVLVNTVAKDLNTRFAVARMNADFPEAPAAAFVNDASRPERNSDHDAPVAYFTLFAEAQPGQLLISEFRHFGPGGAEDEFVEIYNNTAAEHVVAATDGSAGYSVSTAADQAAGAPRCVIPNGTRIPARGHFLCVNSDGYSLAGYPSGTSRNATPDATYTEDTPPNAGLALFSTAFTANYNAGTRLDAAGSVSETDALYKEGAGYPDIGTTAREYSFFRDLRPGTPRDTNDNAADFLYVNTAATDEGAGGRLGAPGPQNLSSPVQLNALIKASLIDPLCSDVGTAVASLSPGTSPDGTPVAGCQNTARDFTPLVATQPQTSAQGTFYIRRRFRNNTAQNVVRLRFRVVDITSTPQAGVSDLRLLSSGAVTYATSGSEIVTVQGLVLEEPPAQALGGGFNSSAQCCATGTGVAGERTISLAQPLLPNGTIDVQFRFGVMNPGAYRFFVNVEAETQPAVVVTAPSKAGAKAGAKADKY
jgi:uncharacterized protein